MSHRDVIAIGASAGGIEALQQLVGGLPPDLDAAVFVTVHFPENGTSVLPRILTRAGRIPAVHAVDGEPIVSSRIYVAQPGCHLILERDQVRLVRGPRENGNRPAIDPMFRSAAIAFGPRVIGVVLTGLLDDGTSGLAAIKRYGGAAVVQDPDDALFPTMPLSAINYVKVDHVVPVRSMAKTLSVLVAERLPVTIESPTQNDVMEKKYSTGDLDAIENSQQHPGKLSPFGCPDCGGVLWEMADGEFVRYRCRVGHAWTSEALLQQQADSLDDALWTALRALEESASLSRQIATRHRSRGVESLATRFDMQAEMSESRASVIRDSLLRGRDIDPDMHTVAESPGKYARQKATAASVPDVRDDISIAPLDQQDSSAGRRPPPAD
jgi:two-component system chemotaxis response regulator CheB